MARYSYEVTLYDSIGDKGRSTKATSAAKALTMAGEYFGFIGKDSTSALDHLSDIKSRNVTAVSWTDSGRHYSIEIRKVAITRTVKVNPNYLTALGLT